MKKNRGLFNNPLFNLIFLIQIVTINQLINDTCHVNKAHNLMVIFCICVIKGKSYDEFPFVKHFMYFCVTVYEGSLNKKAIN